MVDTREIHQAPLLKRLADAEVIITHVYDRKTLCGPENRDLWEAIHGAADHIREMDAMEALQIDADISARRSDEGKPHDPAEYKSTVR